jgi:NAD(P)-dependent dehydrogenase (short-subunit alcohol dehydrogenase family)
MESRPKARSLSVSQPVWFITGVSRGLGRALAAAVLARGDTVVGTTRDGASDLAAGAGVLHVVPLDVTAEGQAVAAVERAHELTGRIDVVVNNAGHGLLASIEQTPEHLARELFDVNFFGALRVTQAVLPHLRAQRSGHIVNLSSVAGRAPAAGSGLYAASKCALAGMSEALAAELAPLGIHVTIVEPGAFRTDFLASTSVRTVPVEIADYDGTAGATLDRLVPMDGLQLGDPYRAVEAIISVVEAPEPPLHLVLGADALDRSRANVAALTGDMDRWEHVSRETGFIQE